MVDVTFERVSKRYRVRQPAHAGRLMARLRPGAVRDFWAIRDVSFQVGRGETLGIIGHNGAGKSTILKLLSQITTPTSGEIRLEGRVAALIEVGSGFHPELTGRENVYLSGALLGMKRREIKAKFDRIVDFSGVSEFIDTPVKWYSSGMYVRLGFSVAAHLDPDILLVDEVLAVGDAAFQIQCIERLNELRHGGMTMLFISHDLTSIEKLCDRVALMRKGQLAASGAPHQIVAAYQQMVDDGHAANVADVVGAAAHASVAIDRITFHDGSGSEVISASTGSPLAARVHYRVSLPVEDAIVEVFYYSSDGRTLHCQQSTAVSGGQLRLERGAGALEFSFPSVGLQPGTYSVGAAIRERSSMDTLEWFYGRTMLYVEPGKSVRGYFYAPHEWRLVAEQAHARDRHSHV